jgi:hypothetical protein
LRKLPSFSTVIGVALVIIGVVAAVVFWQAGKYGQIGAGFVARQMCSCLYVQNRSETACRAEIDPQIPQIERAQIVYMDERVIVNFIGLDLAEARLLPGYGCNVQTFVGSMPAGVLNGVAQD